MTDRDKDEPIPDAALDAYFAAARAQAAPRPSEALMTRIAADAGRAMPARPGQASEPVPLRPRAGPGAADRIGADRTGATTRPVNRPAAAGLRKWLAGALGGLVGAPAGLLAAGLTGLWLGFAPPQAMLTPLATIEAALRADDPLLALASELESWSDLPENGLSRNGDAP